MPGLHHALYNWLVWAAQPWLRRKLARRALAEPLYGQAVQERFGHHTQRWDTHSPQPRVWLHAVSLGEVRAAGVLLPALRQALPGMRLLLTHGTATGRAEGQRWLQPGDVQVWQPWDTPAAVQSFLQSFQPHLGLLMETEVWPNLVRCSRQAGVPLVLVNARMSARSLRAALRWPGLMRPTYAALHAAWAQTEDDAERLRALGAPQVAVTGNLKFDATPDAAQRALGQNWRAACPRPVLMLASSREGEEALWLRALQALPPVAQSSVQWLLVPRHPQRVDAVQALLESAGWGVSRRSTWTADGPGGHSGPTVWLGDSLGEMALYYSLADVALLGGSFEPLGGQNLIEAAACGCPVLMGPHTFNFLQVAEQAERAGAARRVADMGEALQQALWLVRSPAEHTAMAEAAQHFVRGHTGAAQRVAERVRQLWAGR